MHLSFDNMSQFSTSVIFLVVSLSENNSLKVFQNAPAFLPQAGSDYCNRHVWLFYSASTDSEISDDEDTRAHFCKKSSQLVIS